MAPKPLPPVREDPAYLEALAATQKYTLDAQAARQNFTLTEIGRQTAVVQAWQVVVARLAELRKDLYARRRARREWIEQQLPIGPGIAEGTSAADRVVLLAAFNNALDKAKASTQAQRGEMLNAAERFDDDVTRRAVLTAAMDDSQWQLLDGWAAAYDPDTGALLTEWLQLAELLQGTGGTDGAFEMQGFRPPPRPSEWFTLPALVKAHNAAVVEHNRSRGPAVMARTDLIDLGDLLMLPTGVS